MKPNIYSQQLSFRLGATERAEGVYKQYMTDGERGCNNAENSSAKRIAYTAIVLAGGLGTRLREVVSDVPKPMAPIRGRPFLEYLFDYWIKQGVNHFVLSVGYKHDVIQSYFGNAYQDAALEYVVEATPLGTGGGFLLAAEKLKNESSFLLLNGDTYFEVDLQKLIQFAEAQDADWCFSLFRTQNTKRYMGINTTSEGRIDAFASDLLSAHECLANGGVYWVNKRVLKQYQVLAAKCSLEQDVFGKALALNQRLYGLECPGTFIDIGVPQDYYRSALLFV